MRALTLILLLLPALSFAEDFRVLTWNVFMLPKPIKNSEQKIRSHLQAEALSKISSELDLLVLNEAFTKRSRDLISEATHSDLPYSAKLRRKGKLPIVMDSGLLILSRHPMSVIGESYYKKCGRADCYAAKGVLLVEVTLPSGNKVQVAATHMQSGKDPKYALIRNHQLEQIKTLLQDHAVPGVPQILMGDLNLNENDSEEFTQALERLGMQSASITGETRTSKASNTECFGKKNEEGHTSWIDHVLLKNDESGAQLDHKKALSLTGEIKGTVCDLSDHLPVSALIKLEKTL